MTWSEEVSYACACGLQVKATRVRWVDAEANAALRDQVEEQGPLIGNCPRCNEPFQGHASWIELHPSRKRATLVLASHQRGELVQELVAHLERAANHGQVFESWVLSPHWRFVAKSSETTVTRPQTRSDGVPAMTSSPPGVPMPMGHDPWGAPKNNDSVRDAWVCSLTTEGGVITLEVTLAEAERKLWGQGALRARPIHLDALGMPLIGARVVVSYLGQAAVIDGVVDPSTAQAAEIFASLSQEFRLQLVVREAERPRAAMRREVASAGLERNAALCLESARQLLLEREIDDAHDDLFVQARNKLAALDRKARLQPAARSLAVGAFQHLAMPSEIVRALDELEAVSQRDNLRHILEVDGLPVDEYEAIRKRVLKAAFDFGLCAPARFWRRAVESGIAPTLEEYAAALVRRRAELEASDDDDLTLEQAARAWRDLGELVEKKALTLPADAASLLRAHRAADAVAAPRHPEASVLAPRSGEVLRSPSPQHKPEVEPSRPRVVPRKSNLTLNPDAKPSAPPSESPVSSTSGQGSPSAPAKGSSSPLKATSGVPEALELQITPVRGTGAVAPPVPGQKSASASRSASAWPGLTMGKEERPASSPRAQQSAAEGLAQTSSSDLNRDAVVRKPLAAASSSSMLIAGERNKPVAGATPDAKPSALTQQAVDALGVKGLNGEARDHALRLAFTAWDQGQEADWLALIPALAPFARMTVPRLLFKLVAPHAASRLSAALLLGCAHDPASIAPLCARVFREPSGAWLDMARALTFGGERAVEELCAAFGEATGSDIDERSQRLTAALAELAAAEGPEGERAKAAVSRLRERNEADLTQAAARAVAQISDTREARRVRLAHSEPSEGADFSRQASYALARHTLGTGAAALTN